MGKYSLGREFLFKIIALTGCLILSAHTHEAYAEPGMRPIFVGLTPGPSTSSTQSTSNIAGPGLTGSVPTTGFQTPATNSDPFANLDPKSLGTNETGSVQTTGGGGAGTPTGTATSPTGMTSTGSKSPMCDKSMFEGVSKQVERIRAAKDDTTLKYSQPPNPPSAIAQTPCMSQQMASITNKFSNAPSNYTNQIIGGLTGNPVGSLVAGVFRSGYNSGRSAVSDWPQAIGLQNKFNIGMTKLFQSLGLEDSPFASDLCGLMLDSMLSFIQCNTSFNLPSLTMPSFNIPGSCGANVARQGLYQAANKQSFDILAEPPKGSLPRTIPTPAKTGSTP